MKERIRLPALFFYGLTAFMVVISVISFVSAVSWINRPFPGFLIYPFPYVGSFGSRDWPGYGAGVRYMDRIAEVDGQPVLEGQNVSDTVRQKNPGTPD